ncbi:RyR domain-containing protein [Streptomyces griseosporeus]|uniref:RyR domain-containing protein n=1 Tax=Streptomyces griseosporeus TaxID=1910 RepID=UPI0036F93AAE
MPELEDIARVCHEANRAWQIATGDPAPSPPWDEAPQWQRDSAIDSVRHALNGASPELMHQAWCDLKRADGWRYGPVKDAEAKTHPCLVPYAELDAAQHRKDHLFVAIVTALSKEH